MNSSLPPLDALRSSLSALADAMNDFLKALEGCNNLPSIDTIYLVITAAQSTIGFHVATPSNSLADDLLALRSHMAKLDLPREDSELGRLPRLIALRSARGTLLNEIFEALGLAAAVGILPSELELRMPDAPLVERAGFQFMLAGLATRIRKLEDGLEAISAEAKPERLPSVQQSGLINIFTGNVKVEAAIAKVEVTGKGPINFEILGKAVGRIVELTTDFIASVNGMAQLITAAVRESARNFKPLVKSLSQGFRAIIKKTLSTAVGTPLLPPTSPVPLPKHDERLFWAEIGLGDDQRHLDEPLKARKHFDRAYVIAQRLGNAEQLFRRAIKTVEDRGDPNHADVAARVTLLANLLRSTDRREEAEQLFERALTIDEAAFGPDHLIVASALTNLATFRRDNGRFQDAEHLFRRALANTEGRLGPNHYLVTAGLISLANFLKEAKRPAEASPLFRHAAAIMLAAAKVRSRIPPDLAPVLQNYRQCLLDTGQSARAAAATISALVRESGFTSPELLTTVLPLPDLK